jgi:hypothetical protein
LPHLEDISLDQHTLAEADGRDDAVASTPTSLTRRIGAGVAGAAFLSALGPIGAALVSGPAAAQTAITDIDILNFALNLEYVEAEFYLRAISGQGLSASDINGVGVTGGVNGGSAVPFASGLFAQYAENIAIDEQQHVRFLRSALGSAAVARPLIDLAGGFQGAAVAAGIATAAAPFNPFADQVSFFLGAFIFEDVGVTAYAGAAALIQNKAYLSAAASILAIEGYHGGLIRTVLGQLGAAAAFDTQAIANLRAQLSKANNDQGVIFPNNGFVDIAPADGNGLAFRRTTAQVVNIVTGGGQGKGGFLPNGFAGNITNGVV